MAIFQINRKISNCRKIGIWGHYHGGNQGDELIVTTLIQEVHARCPGVEIVGFCQGPADARQRYGIRAFPIWCFSQDFGTVWQRPSGDKLKRAERVGGFLGFLKLFLKKVPGVRAAVWMWRRICYVVSGLIQEPFFLWCSYRRLKEIDIIIVAGSGPLFDGWSGPWSHPYAIFKWSMLAWARGTKFVFLSTGAGPIDARLSRFFLRSSLRLAYYRSYRDASSAELIRALDVKGDHPVFPDLAFSLDMNGMVQDKERGSARPVQGIVGVNPMAHADPRYTPRGDPDRFRAYLHKLAEFVEWLIQNDYRVNLLYSQVDADPRACEDLLDIVKEQSGLEVGERLFYPSIKTIDDLVEQIFQCEAVVAARYHCIVLPYLLQIPVVGLAYHRKSYDLMASMGQLENCLDIDQFDIESLIKHFTQIQQDSASIKAELARRVPQCRAALAAQYDQLLGKVQ